MDFINSIKKVVAVALLLLMYSCSGGGAGGGTVDGTSDASGNSTNTTPNQLAKSLIRNSGGSLELNSLWVCFNKNYSFSSIGFSDFGEAGFAISVSIPAGVGESDSGYAWKPVGKNAVDLYRPNGDIYESFSHITFTTVKSLSMVSSIKGYLSCVYLTGEQYLAVYRDGASLADIIKDDPLLAIPKPDGLIEFMSYVVPATVGSDAYFKTVALFEGGVVPGLSGDYYGVNGKPDLDSPRSTYQVNGSTLSLGTYDYEALPLTPAQPNEVLDSCIYWSVTDETNFPGSTFNHKKALTCYYPDGRFRIHGGPDLDTMMRTPFVATPFNSGRYRLDPYTIRYLYDSGYQENDPFSWRDIGERLAMIGGYTFKGLKAPADIIF